MLALHWILQNFRSCRRSDDEKEGSFRAAIQQKATKMPQESSFFSHESIFPCHYCATYLIALCGSVALHPCPPSFWQTGFHPPFFQ